MNLFNGTVSSLDQVLKYITVLCSVLLYRCCHFLNNCFGFSIFKAEEPKTAEKISNKYLLLIFTIIEISVSS